jgi:hypothetical protein
MAYPTSLSTRQIDAHLRYLAEECRELPFVRGKWEQMDAVEREAFHLEWFGQAEIFLRDLRELREAGRLSPEQRAKLDRIVACVEQHRDFLGQVAAEG